MLQLLAALIAIAKAIPAVRDLIFAARDSLEKTERESQRAKDHAAIDADRDRLAAGPWVCPRLCPHRGLHDVAHAEPSQTPAGPA